MSDIEEPPTKMSKYEMAESQTFTQLEELEEGQEEWLSEELLTDDDGNAPTEHEFSDSALGNISQMSNSQDNTNATLDSQDSSTRVEDSNIEQTLNNMNSHEQEDLPEDLDAFLIRKTDVKAADPKPAEESDGNDTDDLLRMLEDDGKTKKLKKATKTYAGPREPGPKRGAPPSSDDDERDDYDVFEGTTIKKMVAKSVLMRKLPATKAVPEDSSDESDASSNEVVTMKKMFGVRKSGNFAAKSTARPPRAGLTRQLVRVTDHTAHRVSQRGIERRLTSSTPVKQYTRVQNKSLLKPPQNGTPIAKPAAKASPVHKPAGKSIEKPIARPVGRPVTKNVKKPVVPIPEVKYEKEETKQEYDEIINEEEFLEEDDFDLDEDFATESDAELGRRASQQRLMEPEQFDEEMLSDGESLSDDGSLYDELPSSDSEELDDWFNLDIRTERAGDYLPLLGPKAYELLLAEKKRVSSRLNSLRESIASLSDNGRMQSNKLKVATAKLAEVDDMLKVS